MSNFMPFDINCHDKLHEQFQYLFEPELINELCANGKLKKYLAEEVIVEIGQSIDYFPILVSGSVKVLTEDKNGDELLLYYLEVGDTCAMTLNCCTKNTKSTIRAVVENDTELLFIPIEKMEDWMIKYRSWRNYTFESYSIRLNELISAIDTLVFSSLEERLINYLRDKAWVNKSNILKISHLEVARELHSSRVVISRLMKKLENEGLVKQSRNKIEFLEFSAK
ncbi:MAG TPA: Crp/Fnr family transcriptional regulator [Saprospiraceae bacterium]|nr:Crp/Fnr family transcriptional regulator [Saprospiraceae bacterium]HPK10293.1 Crp/Fnr family transcriptional regulator [Saprospiraceae bacterium]HPQ21430.1 Crp/Fnr family transcriptional regulator [Saprospiraceae bacterium]HRX29291.1 Crp/Fnr family transcriptional regulator [Saprospiraceae bacterium]